MQPQSVHCVARSEQGPVVQTAKRLLDAATGEPVLERQRKAPAAGLSPNFVDLAYFGGA